MTRHYPASQHPADPPPRVRPRLRLSSKTFWEASDGIPSGLSLMRGCELCAQNISPGSRAIRTRLRKSSRQSRWNAQLSFPRLRGRVKIPMGRFRTKRCRFLSSVWMSSWVVGEAATKDDRAVQCSTIICIYALVQGRSSGPLRDPRPLGHWRHGRGIPRPRFAPRSRSRRQNSTSSSLRRPPCSRPL